jgi:DNA polymerase-3 subunit delta
VVANVKRPATAGLVSWCARHFKQANKQISANDINYMLTIADNDMRSLVGEISKLCNYCQGDTVEKADIDAVVTKSIEANRYDIANAFCAKDYNKVLDIIDKLYKQNVEDALIMGVIIYAFVDMYKVKLATTCGRTAQQAAAELGLFPFAAQKAARNVASLSLEFLESAIAALKNADTKMKSRPYNKRDIITFCIAELIDRRNSVGKA